VSYRIFFYQIINIVFNDFQTESCCDFVFLYDGETTKDKLIAPISGSNQPSSVGYNSTQQYMLVRFLTDASVTARGFTATFVSFGTIGLSEFRLKFLSDTGQLSDQQHYFT
jgi:hypothetical protein